MRTATQPALFLSRLKLLLLVLFPSHCQVDLDPLSSFFFSLTFWSTLTFPPPPLFKASFKSPFFTPGDQILFSAPLPTRGVIPIFFPRRAKKCLSFPMFPGALISAWVQRNPRLGFFTNSNLRSPPSPSALCFLPFAYSYSSGLIVTSAYAPA